MTAIQPAAETEAVWLPGDAVRTGAAGRPVLVGSSCPSCGAAMFPAVPVCPCCMAEDLETVDMPATGTLYSFTEVHVGPAHWSKPVRLGYVDLDNGVRVFSHLAPGPGLAVGARVEIAAGRVGRRADGTPVDTFVFKTVE